MNYKEIFDNKANIYDQYRPRYADELFEYLKDTGIITSSSIVADIGCGTGILARQLCKYVSLVYCIEPNPNMMNEAIESFKGDKHYRPILASAENTTLDDFSVDLISVGQAFHWFDPILFKQEAKRILKKPGIVMLVWNKKQDCDLEQERRSIVKKYRRFTDSYDSSWSKRIQGIKVFFNDNYTELSFKNDIVNTKKEFIMRTLSASHSLERDDPLIESYLSEWNDYFDKYSKNQLITIPNNTIAFIGQL